MKLHEVNIPRDGDHPIMYDLIKKWLAAGKKVTISTNGGAAVVSSIEVEVPPKEKPVHGHIRAYKMMTQWYFVPKGSKVQTLSSHVEETWLYAAELFDAKIQHLNYDDVYIWMPDYTKNTDLLRDR